MAKRTLRPIWILTLGTAVAGAGSLGACGTSGTNDSRGTGGHGAGASGMGGSTGTIQFTTSTSTGSSGQTFDVTPVALQTITVAPGAHTPTQGYTATSNGNPVNVSWSVDQGSIGTVATGPSSTATLTPSGTSGGLVTVTASYNGQSISRQVMVKLVATTTQSGANTSIPSEKAQVATSAGQLTVGGGIGGVGGVGLGGPVTNFPTTVTSGTSKQLKFLYPYDKTVWPRGMLAPLLMWSWTPGDADAIQISLTTTSGSFSWTGQFARPAQAILDGQLPKTPAPTPGTGVWINSPIPQDVWDMATNTAGGPLPGGGVDQLTVSLVVAKGGMAYGPISETWTIAPGLLAGTVYYNSYGTGLVQNSNDKDANGVQYGAAVLAIQGGSLAPVIVAGKPSPLTPDSLKGTGCRVCHVVSADGSQLVVQHGDSYPTTSTYNLKAANVPNAETVLTGYDSTFGWAGLYPDGSLALTNMADMAAGTPGASQLYAFPPAAGGAATPLKATGIPDDLAAGTPAFSGDGKHVSFELLGGTLGTLKGTYTGKSQLVALDFDKATMSFSNPRLLATAAGGSSGGDGGKNAGLPAFFPTNDAVAYHLQLSNPTAHHRYNTWQGATAQVWWSDLATGTAAILGELNGLDGTTSYLPTNSNHPDDTTLNYEPTTAPEVSGGYAWVMFTTRRMYGNVATADPTQSDPRNYDDTDYSLITTKKLWVAAVDIGAIKNGSFVQGWTPGSDPSHPAFYLPAQELMAGNAHGFWVLNPCMANGASCQTGDQCCSGYCEPNGDGGALTCGPAVANMCSALSDKCTTAADCCSPSALCINGYCAMAQQN